MGVAASADDRHSTSGAGVRDAVHVCSVLARRRDNEALADCKLDPSSDRVAAMIDTDGLFDAPAT
jgi:hypothetical protein